MIEQVKAPRFLILTLLVIVAACTRAIPLFVPHVWNFTAVGALAVFAGSQFKNKSLALFMPLSAMALSDLFLGRGFSLAVYTGFICMVLCGIAINRKATVANVGLASIAGALIFFLITNFSFLYSETQYPRTFDGVITSYIMALPFLKNMLIGDAVYGFILFGTFYYLQKKYPVLSYSYVKSK